MNRITDIERLREMHLGGYTQREIATALGVSQPAVAKALKRHGIERYAPGVDPEQGDRDATRIVEEDAPPPARAARGPRSGGPPDPDAMREGKRAAEKVADSMDWSWDARVAAAPALSFSRPPKEAPCGSLRSRLVARR